jgi:hypothetical protein
MQRRTGNRSFNKILYDNQGLNLNNSEMDLLIKFKTEISAIVKTYLTGGSNKDSTLTDLRQISDQIKLKISTIS